VQITLKNADKATVSVSWDPASLPPETKQIQFRSVANVSQANAQVGYDAIANSQSPQLGEFGLNHPGIIRSGQLLQICAAAQNYEYEDLEGSNIAAIAPL